MSAQGVPAGEITSDDKLWACLSYIFTPLIPIIVLLMEDKKNRPFLRYHAFNALVMGIITFILSFIFIGCLVYIYNIYLAVKAYQGEKVEIPVVTNFIRNQGWAQ